MDISLSQNLFLEAGSTLKQNSASKKLQKNRQSEDNLLSTPQDFETQNIACKKEQKSTDDKLSDFDEILAKKLVALKTTKQAKKSTIQDVNIEDVEEDTKSKDLPNILTAQNISLDTNVEDTIQSQADENQNSVRPLENYVEVDSQKNNTPQAPIISPKIDDLNIEETLTPAIDQTQQVAQDEITEIPAEAAPEQKIIETEENININIDPQIAATPAKNQFNIPQTNAKIEESEEIKIDETKTEVLADEQITDNEIPRQTSEPHEIGTTENKILTVQSSDLKKQVSEKIKNNDVQKVKVTDSQEKYKTSIINSDDNQTAKKDINNSDEKTTEPKQQAENPDITDTQPTAELNKHNTQQENSLINNVQSLISAPAQNSQPTLNQENNSDLAAGVGVQIQNSIQSTLSADNKEIVIQLNPPDLGKVEIKFTEENNTLTGVLSVDKPATKHQIQQTLPEVLQNLQDSGINIKKIEVVLSNNQEQQTMKDQSSMAGHNWSGQQNQPNPESHRTGNIYNQWTFSNDSSFVQSYEQSSQYSETYVNMLA